MTPDPKAALRARALTLVARDAALQAHLRGRDGRLDEDGDDVLSFVQGDEVVERLDEAARRELFEIRAALARVDAGTYGACTACGEPIPAARLAAVPEAARCVACAAGA